LDTSVLTLDRAAVGADVPAAARQSEDPLWESVVPDAVDGLWPQVGPMIKRATDWSATSQKMECLDDVRQKLIAGRYRLWICLIAGKIDAALVTQMVQHSRCSVLDIHYGAGKDMLKWLEAFHDLIVADARAAGARFVRIQGRHVWWSTLKRLKFEKPFTTFMLEI
jgi:hypothetical protein